MIKRQKIINLKSQSNNSLNGEFNSNLFFNIANMYKKTPRILYSTIQVMNAQIPLSYYLINESDNKFTLNGVNYELTKGNYDANTFINMFQSIVPITLTINVNTLKFTLSSDNDFTFSTNCFSVMGVEKNKIYTSTNNIFICPFVCDFIGIKRINIKSDELATDNVDSGDIGHNSLLATIPVNSEGVIIYENYQGIENVINKSILNIFDIKIKDSDDNFINFNGKEIYISLLINIYTYDLPSVQYTMNELENI
jgi:hypothetical protein